VNNDTASKDESFLELQNECNKLAQRNTILVCEVETLRDEVKKIIAERDEARRKVCRLLASDVPPPSVHERDPIVHAAAFGWDCF